MSRSLSRVPAPIGARLRRRIALLRRKLGVVLFDRRYGVQTDGRIDLDTFGLAAEDRVEYTPSGWLDVRRALANERVQGDDVFLDLGSGKGRVVLQAARFPFKRVVGVELSAELNAIAWDNVTASRRRLGCPDIELVTADVAAFPIPDDVTFVYIYNAFKGFVFQRALEELIASVDRRPRSVRLLYQTPREHERVIRTGRFDLVRIKTSWRPTRAWADLSAINTYELRPD